MLFDFVIGEIMLALIWLGLIGGAGAQIDQETLIRGAAQTTVVALRSQADIRYDAIVYDPRSGVASIEGLRIARDSAAGRIGAARISSPGGRDLLALRIELDDLTLQASEVDLPMELAVQAALLGVDEFTADVAVEYGYRLSSSTGYADIALEIDGLARSRISAAIGGLRLRPPATPEDEPRLDGEIRSITYAFEDLGAVGLARAAFGMDDMTPAQAEELAAALAEEALRALLGVDADAVFDPEKAPESAREAAAALERETARFLLAEPRIALSIEPSPPLSLADAETMVDAAPTSSRARLALLERLQPRIAASPVLDPGFDPAAGDAPLDLARALSSGVGAPLNPARAIELATPLAEAGDAEAAMVAARAMAARGLRAEAGRAYELAIAAELGGVEGAGALAARLAAELNASTQLAAERAALDAWTPEPAHEAMLRAAQSGDAVAMRRLAEAHERGAGAPRNVERAYYWALLAAAAGERAAVGLRDRLFERFRFAPAADARVWMRTRQAIADQALADWNGGIAAAARSSSE